MNTKIVVLASNSFTGACFIGHCLNQGAEVIGISRSPEPHPMHLPYKTNPRQGSFRFFQNDLNHDLERILTIIREFKPGYVVDLAGQGMVAPSWQYPHQWFKTNVLSKVMLHDQLRRYPFLRKYVRISTPEVYGSTEGKVFETEPMNPSTPYAVSHASIDMSLKSFFNQYGFPVVFTRSTNVYGAHQQLYRIIPRAIICARLGKKLKLDGSGQSIRNFIHIQDVSTAIWKVMIHAPVGETYHIGTDEYVSIRDLVGRISSKMNVRFEDLTEIGEDRPGKDKAYYLDTSKIRTKLGWSSRVSLEEGLQETIRWVDENLGGIRDLPLDYIHKE